MSQGRSASRTRALIIGALVLVVLLVALLRATACSPAASTQAQSTANTGSSARRTSFERVPGGAQDPNLDPAELVLELRGRVIDAKREPVADADVELLFRPAGAIESQARAAMKPVRSNASGEFAISKLRAGQYRLEARKGDAVSPTVEVELSATTAPVVLMLIPGATLTVRVVSLQTDRPIAGALVRVAPGNAELGPVDAHREARTDAQGIAKITGLHPVSNHGVYAEATGYAGASVNVLAGGNPDREAWTTLVRLKPGGVVSGRVIDARGQPVAGAMLRWYTGEAARDADQASQLFSSQQGVIRLGAARSGADGRFRLSAETGAGLLEAVHPSHRTGFARGVVPAGGELALDVTVPDGAQLAGVVLDAQGNPAPGAEVIVTKRGTPHQQMFMDAYRFRATADRNGEFAFVGIAREELSLVAWSQQGSSELVDVDMRSGAEQTGIVLELTRSGTITGVVAESDGTPVAYAQVSFFVENQTVTPPQGVKADAYHNALLANPRSQGVVVAGDDGRFVIAGLVDGDYQLEARRPTATSVAPVFSAAHLGKVRPGKAVTLTLPALGSISGRVVADDGGPVSGAMIAAALWQGAATSYPPGKLVGADGRFKLAAVPAGRYGVKVSGTNLVDARSSDGFDVAGGKDTDVGTIRVTRGVARSGKVVDQTGAPVVAAQVVIQFGSDSGHAFDDVTDERGMFDVPPLPAGTSIRLRAYTREVSSDWKIVGPEVTDIKIVLAAGTTGSIAGLLVQDGQPVEKRMVLLTLDSTVVTADPNSLKSRGNTLTEAGGRFQFKDVPNGKYRLWVRRADDKGPEWVAHPEPVAIQPGNEVFVVVSVPKAQ
jgi:protocatechuate 3,4-dioxygenase beta subunit